eukprot:TRINITY_DN1703_c0_g3_i1.p1 TRINITY_DN1703_c0_g3~~TRINITY_DN1703_c0_g3_i1.p1  ORF type:complete len:1270 (-),score=368.60 TRINITY_DN1703_c0_g3_i1:54-3827(-)
MERERTTTRLYNAQLATQSVLNIRRNTIRQNTQTLGLPKPQMTPQMPRPVKNMIIKEDIMQWNDEKGLVDLIKLDDLTVQAILKNLQERYEAERYYTYCGNILIALNPYYKLNGYYNLEVIKQYRSKRIGEEPPHLFAIVDSAFRTVSVDNKNVSLIISGESGAGKTETTKLILNYLSSVSNEPSPMEAKLIESAALLEAFGNARTVRNKNSSRFGKYIKVLFTNDFKIAGAQVESYLLEKSRVTLQSEGERNYHIFYQMCGGAGMEEKKKYFLKPASDFKLTKVLIDNGLDEAKEFQETRDAMTLFGFDAKLQDFIYRVCSAILHMGEIVFEGNEVSKIVNNEELKIVSNLLQIKEEELSRVFISKTIKVGQQVITKNLKKVEAETVRDSICRDIYSRLFDMVIEMINKSLTPPQNTTGNNFLGVLDIFGFENFNVNSFEQLCINYANEKLHQQFIEHVFKLEQTEYSKEGIKLNKIDTTDNQPCLDLIDNKSGILDMLDEESKLASGTDKALIGKFHQMFKANKYYETPKKDPNSFIVKHYAEPVSYLIDDFRNKNQNTIEDDILNVFRSSGLPHMKVILAEVAVLETSTIRKTKPPTISHIFKSQLGNLKKTLDQTVPFYIRCIKPNLQQKAKSFNPEVVSKQLSYSGMVETVKIRSIGFPLRYDFKEFVGKFKSIEPKLQTTSSSINGVITNAKVANNLFQIGKTKVFFKTEGNDLLEKLRLEALRGKAIKLQAFFRMCKWKIMLRKYKKAAKVFQKNIKIYRKNKVLKRKVLFSLKITQYCEKRRQEEKKKKEEEERKKKVEQEKKKKELEEKKRKEEEERKRKEEIEKKEIERKKKEEEERQKKIKKSIEEKVEKRQDHYRDSLEPMRSSSPVYDKPTKNGETEVINIPTKDEDNTMTSSEIEENYENNNDDNNNINNNNNDDNNSNINNNNDDNNQISTSNSYNYNKRFNSFNTGYSEGIEKGSMESQRQEGSELSEEIKIKLRKIDEITVPDEEEEIVRIAKALQMKVKGQKPAVADKLFSRSIELYEEAINKTASQDNFINCGTALINWACLKLVMPIYPNKEEACMSHLETAQLMLDKAINMGLDQEGRQAVQERIKKIEIVKKRVLEEDLKSVGSQKKTMLKEKLQSDLNKIRPISMSGKLIKQGAGNTTFGRKSWKDRIFVLSEKYLRYYVKNANELPKGEIPLEDITAVKVYKITGKDHAFAITTINRFYPIVASTEGELKEWVDSINWNMNRIRLQTKLKSLN